MKELEAKIEAGINVEINQLILGDRKKTPAGPPYVPILTMLTWESRDTALD